MNRKQMLGILLTTCMGLSYAADVAPPAAADSSADVFMTLTKKPISDQALPTTAEIIRPDQFDTYSAQTAGDVVERMTSVQVRELGGLGSAQTVEIRGSTSKENLVLVDGRPIGGVSFGQYQDLSEIPVETIDHIEVVRGGLSSLYGPDAIGGVINVITRRATEEKPILSAGYEGGSYGRNIFRGYAGAKNGPIDMYAYGDVQGETGFRTNSDAGTTSGGGNVGFSMGKAGKIVVDGSVYQAELGLPGQLFINLPPNQFNNSVERQASTPVSRQDTRSQSIRTAYDVGLPMDSHFNVSFYDFQRRYGFKNPAFFQDTYGYQYSKGVEGHFDLPLGLTVGGTYINDRDSYADNVDASNDFTRSVDNWSVYAQDVMTWKMLTLIPGGRFDHHGQFGDTSNPRVQLMADALPWLRFSGSAARSFRAPNLDELYFPSTDFGVDMFNTDERVSSNPDLQPEKAWTYDAGFEIHVQDYLFKATYFRANITNLIESVDLFTPGNPNISNFVSINVGQARRQGAEIQIEHKVNQYFKDAWNYTYLENRGIPFGFTDFVNLQYSPRHTVNFLATITPNKNWEWNHTVRYEDSRFTGDNETGAKLGSMIIWDMRIARHWEHWDTFFQVKDVTDRRYEEQDGFPLPGRTFIGGLTWKY